MSCAKTILVGAGGAVGKRLCAALADRRCQGYPYTSIIAADRVTQLPPSISHQADVCVGGVDVRDADALMRLFKEYGDAETCVWNLAAPLVRSHTHLGMRRTFLTHAWCGLLRTGPSAQHQSAYSQHHSHFTHMHMPHAHAHAHAHVTQHGVRSPSTPRWTPPSPRP